MIAAFYRGFTSPLALFFSIPIFIITIGVLEISIRRGALSLIPEHFLLTSESDVFLHSTHALSQGIRSKTNSLYLLGGSVVRESFSEESSIEKFLKLRLQENISVFNMGYFVQSFIENLSMVDYFPLGFLLIGVNMRRFTLPPEHMGAENDRFSLLSRWLVQSNEAQSFLKSEGVIVQKRWLSSGVFEYLALRLREKNFKTQNFNPHLYEDKAALSLTERTELKGRLTPIFTQDFDKYFEVNQRALIRLIDLAKQKGFKTVLFELPFNPDYLGGFESRYELFKSTVESLSSEKKIPLWQCNVGLRGKDFYDHTHLIDTGRKKIEGCFLNRLVHWISSSDFHYQN